MSLRFVEPAEIWPMMGVIELILFCQNKWFQTKLQTLR